jgi:Uma2 family endonuclease
MLLSGIAEIRPGEANMAIQPKTLLTQEEYLSIERKSECRSEFIRGEVVAMTGASRRHNLIVANIIGELRQQLKNRPCEIYANDMRVKIPAANVYTYPDAVVVCGEPQFEDTSVDTLLNPTLIVEVLSESTESYDRGRKSAFYRRIQSLSEYLLVAQDEYRIEQYVKQADGRWLISDIRSLAASTELSSIQCVLMLKEVYDKAALI